MNKEKHPQEKNNNEDGPASIELEKYSCPVCGNKINWKRPIGSFNHIENSITIVAECWSGDIHKEMPKHFFAIHLENIPFAREGHGRIPD